MDSVFSETFRFGFNFDPMLARWDLAEEMRLAVEVFLEFPAVNREKQFNLQYYLNDGAIAQP